VAAAVVAALDHPIQNYRNFVVEAVAVVVVADGDPRAESGK